MSDDIKKLSDILNRIDIIDKICKKHGGIYEALEDSEEAQPAIMMHLIMCNENIDKVLVSDEVDIRAILSPKEIRGLKAIRNIAAHDYEGLDFSIIYDVIKNYLPSIKANLANFLSMQKDKQIAPKSQDSAKSVLKMLGQTYIKKVKSGELKVPNQNISNRSKERDR